MGLDLYEFYDGKGGSTILIALAIILMSGFLLSRITKLLKLPNVTAYILAGVIIGPCVLDLIPHYIIDNMGFLSDLALGFIAFGVGKFFKKEVLKQTGIKVVVITLAEALFASFLVTFITYLLFPNLGFNFAILLGAIASATAPASTMMTINQYKAKGDFVNTLLQVVALDDVICLLAFSVATAIASSNSQNQINVLNIVLPILYNLGFMLVGLIVGLLLPSLTKGRSKNSKLIVVVGLICTIAGTASLVDVSPLLSCMIFGAIYLNKTNDEEMFAAVDQFDPPIMLPFFVMSGMNMDITAFKTIGIVGVVYFVTRLIGKYFGTYFSAKLCHSPNETKKYLGFALAPQAGVAIGLAFLAARILPQDIGDTFLTVILCSSVLYELLGPILAKYALIKSKSINPNINLVEEKADIIAKETEAIKPLKELKIVKKER